MVFFVIGGLMIIGGILLLRSRAKTEDQLLEVRSTKLSNASDLNETHRTIFDQIGPGGFSQLSEVQGRVIPDRRLRSELAEVDCVWYSARVEERYEETYTETDSEGKSRTRTRTASDTVSSNTRGEPFLVKDETGTVRVDPEGAKLEGEVVMDRHEPYDDSAGEIRIGSFSIRPTTGRRVLGYTYHEVAIPVDAEVYVIGDACDRIDGKLCIRKPVEVGKPFVISTRSEEEIVDEMEKSATMKKWGALALVILGGVAVAWGIL